MKLKVLPIPFWAENCNEFKEESDWTKITPIIGRDGFYYSRETKKCWIEIAGEVWESKDYVKYYLYELEFLNFKPLTRKKTKEYGEFLKSNYSDERIWKINYKLYNDNVQYWELIDIYRNSRMHTLRILKEIDNEEERIG